MAKKKSSWLWGQGPAEEAKDYWRQLVDSARGGYDWMTDTDASPKALPHAASDRSTAATRSARSPQGASTRA